MVLEGNNSPDSSTSSHRVERRGRTRKVSRYTLKPSPDSLATVREFIRTSLEPFSAVEPHMFDIVSATHEACKNAVVHNPGSDEPVDVVCEVLDDSVVVEVADRGQGFDADRVLHAGAPEPDAVEGRGIFMIYSLMDAVETETGSNGTRITMQKRFRPAV